MASKNISEVTPTNKKNIFFSLTKTHISEQMR